MNRAERRRAIRNGVDPGELVEPICVPAPMCDCPPVFMVLRCGSFLPVHLEHQEGQGSAEPMPWHAEGALDAPNGN